MSGQFEFPEHPLSNREDPFVDETGKNPFADGENHEQPCHDPYRSRVDDFRPYQPRDFVTSVRSRGSTILMLGLCGFLTACCATLSSTFRSEVWMTPVAFWSVIVSLAFGPAAWVMGVQDLHAIRAGAMDAHRRHWTTIGCGLGMLSTVASVLCVVYLVASLVLWWDV